MRVTAKANVVVTDGTNNKDKLFAPDDGLAATVLDGLQESASGREAMAIADVYNVPFGALDDARGFFIRAEGDFDLLINGGPTIQIRRGITGTGGAKAATARCLMEAQVTSLKITAVEAGSVVWAVWGKPLA